MGAFDDVFGDETPVETPVGAPAPSFASESVSVRAPVENKAEKAAKVARTDAALTGAKTTGKQAIKGVEATGTGAQTAIDAFRKQGETAIAEQQTRETEQMAAAQIQFDKADDVYKQAVTARSEYRSKVMKDLENMDTWGKRLASEQPRDAWAEAPTWLKVTSIAAMGLGAAAQAYYGDRTNAVTDQIDNALKRDLMMQKLRLEKNKDSYANKGLLLRQFVDTSDHMQQAEDKAYVTAIGGITARLTANKNLLISPIMRQNLEKTIAELKMKAALKQQDVSADIIGKDLNLAKDTAHIQAEREKAGSELSSIRASTAQGNLALKQQANARSDNALTAPNVVGTFRDPKAAHDYREAEAQGAQLVQGLADMEQLLEQRDLVSLSDKTRWNQLGATLELISKGKDVYNLGAALTGVELERLRKAMGTGDWGYFLSDLGKQSLSKAKEQIAATIENRMKAEGVTPGPNHPFLEAQ